MASVFSLSLFLVKFPFILKASFYAWHFQTSGIWENKSQQSRPEIKFFQEVILMVIFFLLSVYHCALGL